MTFNNHKAEELTLMTMIMARFEEMRESNEYSFEDGAIVSEFINNSIEWFRNLKLQQNAPEYLTHHGENQLKMYEEVNEKYGFNITVDLIEDNTIYSTTNYSYNAVTN